MKGNVLLSVCFMLFWANPGSSKEDIGTDIAPAANQIKALTLSDLTEHCPRKTKVNFYKSLFFVNGALASMNIKDLEECLSPGSMDILGDRLGKFTDPENRDYKNYDCLCNKSNRLGCRGTDEDTICDTFTCWGDCEYSEKRRYSFREKYISLGEIFDKAPENTAVEFIDGLALDKGRVRRISVTRDMLKFLGGEDVISVLMGYDREIAGKIKDMAEHISGLREKSAKDPGFSDKNRNAALADKYDELFGGQKLRFSKYDDEILEELWDIYVTLISWTLERKYLSEAETVFKNFAGRNIHEMKSDKTGRIPVETLFSLYMKLGDPASAKELKQKYPVILEGERALLLP
ncbi:MAG: hypothetical protein FD189_394 [Elusimicrobia bacterium]|nr:MAG: hypothetical protein FD154_474 [Elusimicrobiota bacterium]KAF0157873.1 MAG: hypothetical protein FD189_394 [Elusimicrobiota bacterium]